MGKRPDTEEYSIQHVIERCLERYGYDMTPKEYNELSKLAQDKVSKGKEDEEYIFQIPFRENLATFIVVWESNRIKTLLPNIERIHKVGNFYTPQEIHAMEEIYNLLKYNYIRRIDVLPDLTTARPVPVGTSVEVFKHIYPKWIGTDIGCGITLFKLKDTIQTQEIYKNMTKILHSNYNSKIISKGDINSIKNENHVLTDKFDDVLGTIGGGNHFAELMYTQNSNSLYLCVHSGSRNYGVDIQTNTEDKCMLASTKEANKFMALHDDAINWAKTNRILIAKKFCNVTKLNLDCMMYDLTHNFIEKEDNVYIHRKGSIPSNRGPAMIPGSRGTSSYLVEGSTSRTHSLPHGAGRILSRGEAKNNFAYLSEKDMAKTDIGSYVVSRNESLMRTEHPDCYKDIDNIMDTLSIEYDVKIIAKFLPIITIKM